MSSAQKSDNLLLFLIILLISKLLLQHLHGNMRRGDRFSPPIIDVFPYPLLQVRMSNSDLFPTVVISRINERVP